MKRSPTPLEFALLGLLHQEPRSGYDVRKVFATTPMGHYSDSPGAIYPALRRLESQGLVSGKVDRSKTMRPRKVFRPTRQGVRTLEAWVTRPVTRDDVVWRMEELLLRFAFMDLLVGSPAVCRFLQSLTKALEAHVEELESYSHAMREPDSLHGRLALESGIASYRTHTRWARRALAEMTRLTEGGVSRRAPRAGTRRTQ